MKFYSLNLICINTSILNFVKWQSTKKRLIETPKIENNNLMRVLRYITLITTLIVAIPAIASLPQSVHNTVSEDTATTAHQVVSEKFAIDYRFDQIVIDSIYLDNKEEIDYIKYYLNHTPRIDSITIYAWASPEGATGHNEWLAQERALAAKQFLIENCPDTAKLNADKIKIQPSAENWPGLIQLVEQNYHRKNRDLVLHILRNPRLSNATRKWRLQHIDDGTTWRYFLRHYMPHLRYATWSCTWIKLDDPLLPSPAFEVSVVDEMPATDKYTPVEIVKPQLRTIMAAKTNLLYDAVTALNFAIEFPIADQFSLLAETHFPWWLNRDNRKCLQLHTYGGEFRWWFLPQPTKATPKRQKRDVLVGHFIGLNGWGGYGDIQWGRDFGCYQFDFWSVGLSYGYAMPISRYLNLEFSISGGYAHIPYQHYIPTEDWMHLIRDDKKAGTLHYLGLTKLQISLIFPIMIKY